MKASESASVSARIPRHDYDQALKSAVSWLGDRYLLAAPLHKRSDGRKDFQHATHSVRTRGPVMAV